MKQILRVIILCLPLIFWPFLLTPLRDPFYSAKGWHTYNCAAIGMIHGGSRFALLSIDARCYRVKERDCIAGHSVVKITYEMVILKDEQGREHYILLKKDPSTWVS